MPGDDHPDPASQPDSTSRPESTSRPDNPTDPPLHSAAVRDLLGWFGPYEDEVLAEMTARAEREAFPTVGPEVGRTLALCTRLSGARSVLELGSGYGYSAYWIARALPADGTVTLIERDRALLEDARRYFRRGGLADRARFERGDAIEIAREFEADCDLVVLDHDTADYVAGFEAIRRHVTPGGVVVADNVAVYAGEPAAGDASDRLDPAALLATLDCGDPPNDRTRDVAAFLRRIRADPAFEAYILPVGEGLAVAWKRA